MSRPRRSQDRVAGRKAVRRFLLIFLGLVGCYYGLTLIPWVDANVLYPVLVFSAQGSSFLVNLTGDQTTVQGVLVQGSKFVVAVRRGCDPLEPIALFGAAVIAFPASWKRKVCGLAIGAALLFMLNLVRIGSLYLLGKSKSTLFETLHLELWPAFFILVALSLWVLWLMWIRDTTQPENA